MWYEPEQTLSHNCLLNFVVSARGAGKTYSTLKYCINRFLKTGEQTIYLRRTERDIEDCFPSLLDYLIADGVFDFQVKISKDVIYVKTSDNEEEQWRPMIFGKALSTVRTRKSVAYPLVKYIIFDEFIGEYGTRYLPNEVKTFLGFIETVQRMREIKVICLANLFTTQNMYFDYFKIHPRKESIITKDKNRGILIHKWSDADFIEAKSKTKFAQLIKDTEYGNFMLNNDSIGDNFANIDCMSGTHVYCLCRICHVEGIIYCWVDTKNELIYYNTTEGKPNFTIICDDFISNNIYERQQHLASIKKERIYKFLLKMSGNNMSRYENSNVKYIANDILGNCI